MSSHSLKIAQFITQYPYPEQFDGGADYYCAGAARVAQQISEAFARKGPRGARLHRRRRPTLRRNGTKRRHCPPLAEYHEN